MGQCGRRLQAVCLQHQQRGLLMCLYMRSLPASSRLLLISLWPLQYEHMTVHRPSRMPQANRCSDNALEEAFSWRRTITHNRNMDLLELGQNVAI
jgi:hypothetical protein